MLQATLLSCSKIPFPSFGTQYRRTMERGKPNFPLFLTALRAGLRRGELGALKWGDIQFGASEQDANRYILVQRNYVYGQFTTPKSNKPRRVDLSR